MASIKTNRSDEESVQSDHSPFLDYLKTEQGHEITKMVLGIIEALKKSTLEKTVETHKIERWIQLAVLLAVIVAASLLSFYDKLNATTGLLFGTLVGYLFGKKI